MIVALLACIQATGELKKSPKDVMTYSKAIPVTSQSKASDTQKVVLKDSLLITKEDIKAGEVKVIVQEPAKSNWFKDVLPIISLLLGILINKGLDYFSDQKKIKKAGKRWHAELLSLDVPIQMQIIEIEKALKHQNETPLKTPTLVSYSSLDGEAFQSLDKSELLAYVNKYKSKDFHEAIRLSNKINFFVSVLKSHAEQLKKRFEDYISRVSALFGKVNVNLQELRKAFHDYQGSLINQHGNAVLNSNLYKPLEDLFLAQIEPHLDKGDFDLFKLKKNFFVPMIQELEKLNSDERTRPMVNHCRSSLDNIKGLEMEILYFSTNLQTLVGFFKEDKSILEGILKDIAPNE